MTPNQVAELLMVTPTAVRQWAEKGDIAALTTPGGHRRFLRTEVMRFAQQRGLSFPVADQSVKILIVEDDEFFSHYLKTVLHKLNKNIEIEVVNGGFQAGLIIKEFKPSIVLLDLVMPGIDGFEVCKLLKESPETNSIRVIVITSHTDDDKIQRIISSGAETCLHKPIDIDTLEKALNLPVPNEAEISSNAM